MGLPLPPSRPRPLHSSPPPGPWLNFFSSSQLPQLSPLARDRNRHPRRQPPPPPSPHHHITTWRYRDIEWNFDKITTIPRSGIPHPTHRLSIWDLAQIQKATTPRNDQSRGFKRMQRNTSRIPKFFNQPCSSIETFSSIGQRLYVCASLPLILHLSTYLPPTPTCSTYIPHTSYLLPLPSYLTFTPSPQPHTTRLANPASASAPYFPEAPTTHLPTSTPVTTLFNPTPLSPLDRHGSRHEPQHRSFERNDASQFSQSHTCSPPLWLL